MSTVQRMQVCITAVMHLDLLQPDAMSNRLLGRKQTNHCQPKATFVTTMFSSRSVSISSRLVSVEAAADVRPEGNVIKSEAPVFVCEY